MLWSIDSCQNRVFADQYHLTVSRAQVSTHRGRVFFEVIRWQITSFKWSQAQVYFFPRIHIKYVVFMSLWPCTIRILISNWPRERKFIQFFFKVQAGKTLSYHGHTLHPIFILWLVKIWQVSSCGNLCSILKLVYFDSWNWQSSVSTCDVLQEMKFSWYQESSVIRG